MVKKIVIGVLSLSIITGILLLNNTSDNTFKLGDVTLAVNLDGNPVNSLPAKSNLRVDVSCTNALGRWLYDSWELEIDDIEGDVSCDIDFVTNSSDTLLNAHITSLAGTVQGTGEVVNENGIRYEGKQPNNYIWFNEEYWRVIGVFDTTLADGTTTETLTKIIRAESIGGLAWDSGNVGEWQDATLNELLNTSYLNSENGTGSVNCYGYSTTVPSECNYTRNGIKQVYLNMIENVTWNIGEFGSATTASTLYTSEQTKTSTGKIGLMNVSDYGYSVLASSCVRTTNLSSYNTASCGGSSWLYKAGIEWTINASSSFSSGAWRVSNNCNAYATSSQIGFGVRPVLYLSSTTKYLDGAGSLAAPLIIEQG